MFFYVKNLIMKLIHWKLKYIYFHLPCLGTNIITVPLILNFVKITENIRVFFRFDKTNYRFRSEVN